MTIEKLKNFLEKRRNINKANMVSEAIEEDGYFNAYEYSGGNFDDCFQLGCDVGEAEFIEELLQLISV